MYTYQKKVGPLDKSLSSRIISFLYVGGVILKILFNWKYLCFHIISLKLKSLTSLFTLKIFMYKSYIWQMYLSVGVTVAILITQERNDSLRFLDQIKRIYHYRHPLIGKDIFTTHIQT